MKLPKFLQGCWPKNWSQRVSSWPSEYPHRIVTHADVAALQHTMFVGGALNIAAINHLVRDEEFWRDLSRFFQGKINELEEIEMQGLPKDAAVRKVPLYCWDRSDIFYDRY